MAPMRVLAALCLCALQAWNAWAQAEWQTGTIAQLNFGSKAPPSPGACGYGDVPSASWPFANFASLDPATSPFALGSTMSGCGICLEMECTGGQTVGCSSGTVKVLVTDWCTGCRADFLYISPAAFRSIFFDSVGQVFGRFRRVPCDPPGDISVHVDSYRPSQGGWIRLSLLGVAGTGDITSVEIKGSSQADTSWKPMQRTFGASWEASVLPPPPLDLRITSNGEQAVARGAITEAGVTGNFATRVQLQEPVRDVGAPLPLPEAPASLGVASFNNSIPQGASPSPEPLPAPLPVAPPSPEPATSPAINATGTLAALPVPQTAEPNPADLAPAPEPGPEAAPPALEDSSVALLTPQTASVIVPPVGILAPAAPEEEPSPAPEEELAPAPEEEQGANFTMGAYTEAGYYCASCTPCLSRLDEAIGLQTVPVDFTSLEGLPSLPTAPAGRGPATAADVAAAGGVSPTNCTTMLQILEGIPEAADWLELMQRVGLEMLLGDPKARITLLVPVGEALNATINACPLRNETLLSELLVNAPELANPLVGYHVIRGLWPSYNLLPGTSINSSDTIDKVNFLQVQVGRPPQLRGIGSNANILQGDIVACGPSVIHLIDEVLLPFTFNQGAIDAISGTQVPQQPVTASKGPTNPPAGGRRLLQE